MLNNQEIRNQLNDIINKSQYNEASHPDLLIKCKELIKKVKKILFIL